MHSQFQCEIDLYLLHLMLAFVCFENNNHINNNNNFFVSLLSLYSKIYYF